MVVNGLTNAHKPDFCPPKIKVKTLVQGKPSSFRLFSKKTKTVYSAQNNAGCSGTKFLGKNSTGGPGDNTTSVDPTFSGGLLRLPQAGKKGTDKQHGSYERYLAKKVYNHSLSCS
mgnify:CR=1 FL=1